MKKLCPSLNEAEILFLDVAVSELKNLYSGVPAAGTLLEEPHDEDD
jgi:hypothetical protein